MSRSPRVAVAAVLVTGSSLAACTGAPADGPAGGAVTVTAGDSRCAVAATGAPAGTITFDVTNTGTKATDFSLLGPGGRIMGEAATVGAGRTGQLVVEVPDGGAYTTACTPGMVGDGIRAPFTVTGTAPRSADPEAMLAEATAGYRRYVVAQAAALVSATEGFADAVQAGDVEAAKALFPLSRTHWERIEPVAESLGDLHSTVDGREDDDRDPGVQFTGYHRLEKDLWVDGLQPDSGAVADRLMADLRDLQSRVGGVDLTPAQVANGAKELLDEVVTGKITGEENRYSHTDLWDLRANIEGAQAAVAALRPVIDEKDPALGPRLDARFGAVGSLLQSYRVGDGLRPHTELGPADLKRLTDAVDALGEPVSQVAAVVTS